MSEQKRRVGRPRSIDRENSTNNKKDKTNLRVFKRTRKIFDRLYINSSALNRQQFIDAIINYTYENEKDFYSYFDKLSK